MSSKRVTIAVVLVLAVVAVGGTGLWIALRGPRTEHEAQTQGPGTARYHCPMHPTMLSDRPGECPICHMALVPIQEEAHEASEVSLQHGAKAAEKYHCPMHPTVLSDRPGECPICHMALVPIQEEPAEHVPVPRKTRVVYRSTMNPNEVSDHPGKDSMGMDMVAVEMDEQSPVPAREVPGLAPVRISARKQQLIGVRTSPAVRAPFLRSIRAVGRVTVDETRLRHIHTKVAGYVETLHANATGEPVRKGAPLLEIYSPELLASQQEFLLAIKARERTAGSRLPAVAASGEELVASARRRLELFDLSEAEIRRLEETGQARRTVTLDAPISGTILQRMVTQGHRVDPEMNLLDLADLSRVWVVASVYEYELPFVHAGQTATMTLAYLPGQTYEGRVSLIYPVLDAATRTAQVRLEFPNPGLQLKPDMYAEVALAADLGERLAVPDSAVLETGLRSVVFVDMGEGLFEPRAIRVGLRLPDLYEVLDGLVEGERVLTSANFYVDSESKLKAALAAMAEPPEAETAPRGAPDSSAHRH